MRPTPTLSSFSTTLIINMLGHQFAFSAAPVRKVKEVQFGILSPEEIVRIVKKISLLDDGAQQ